MSLASAALVSLLAFASPLIVRLIRLPVPDIVVQILLGIIVGPQVLGWARIDGPVHVLSLIGLSFLLFLAGLELDFDRLRGRVLRTAAAAYVLSFALVLAVGGILRLAGLVKSPLLIAVILAATSVGIVIPILSDSGEIDTPLGRLVVAGGSLAEVLPVLLLSLLFSEQASGLGSQVTLLAAFCALVAAAGLLIFGLERWHWTGRTLLALQDTTAQIRVRAAVALLMSIPVVGGSIGVTLGLIRPENYVPLVAAGLLSVIVFPIFTSAPRPSKVEAKATQQGERWPIASPSPGDGQSEPRSPGS
jgi:Kef-type K+ transport system membrane component KefB